MATGRFGTDLETIAYASINQSADMLTVCDANGNDLGTGPEDKKIAVQEFSKRSLATADLAWMSALANMAAVDGAADKLFVWDNDASQVKTLLAGLVKNALLTTTDISGLGTLANYTALASTDKIPVWDASATAIKMLPITSLTYEAQARIHGWIIITDATYGAVGDDSTDCTTAIVSAINAAGADDTVFVPQGIFRHGPITHTATFTGGIRIFGVNRYASLFKFVPTGDDQVGVTIDRTSGGSVSADIFNGLTIQDVGFTTADTSYDKAGLKLVDCGQTILENVNIFGFTGTGKDGVGLWTLGRQSLWASNMQITGCVPIRIGVNPDLTSGYLSSDHFTFHNMYLTSYGTTNALTSAVVLVDSGAHVSQLQFTGSQAWVGGSHGFHWNMAAATNAYCSGLSFENVRWEGGALSTGWSVYVNAHTDTPLHNLTLKNCELDGTREGVYTRYVYHQVWTSVLANGASPRKVMDAGSGYSITWQGVMTSTSASSTAVAVDSNFYLVKADPQPSSQIWPTNASWARRSTAANYNERPSREMSAHKWYWAGQLTDDSTVQLPVNNGNNWEHAKVTVIGSVEASNILEYGEYYVAPVTGLTNGIVKGSGSTNAVVGDTDAKLCVFCDGAGPMDAGVYVKNRLGATAWVTVEVVGKRSVET